jgi:hypothetical protein
MPSQPCSETFPEGWMKTHSLAEKFVSLVQQIVANVALSQSDAGVTVFPFASLPSQRERFFCNL